MDKKLLSVGIDVGTTSTQLIVSRLTVENRGSAFSVPEMVIGDRKILYRSPVYFTPLLSENVVDGDGIRQIVAQEYQCAGITPEAVDTGAVIITGETSRKENARTVLYALQDFAGDFVTATAGPDLESALAAQGAGAVAFSRDTGKAVLHMDIGGGTANLAWIEKGKIVETGCLNVGGRLIKMGESGEITYISPVLSGICDLRIGEVLTEAQARQVAQQLVQALEMAAGLRVVTPLLAKLWTAEGQPFRESVGHRQWHLSFSGGVADCIETAHPWNVFGDIGPILGQAIRESRLCCNEYRLGTETIRATVIGAGCHLVQLSGSTVFCRGVALPLQNLPVLYFSPEWVWLSPEKMAAQIMELRHRQDREGILFLPIADPVDYAGIKTLAQGIVAGFEESAPLVAVQADMAKALGQAMALLTEGPILCLDGIKLDSNSYLDVGASVGTAFSVTVKTLILGTGREANL